MATVAESLKRSSLNIGNISKSISSTQKNITDAGKSVDSILKIISNNTKIKTELYQKSSIIEMRRKESSKRREMEDQIEASKVSTVPARGMSFAASSSGGIFNRILSFLGYITAGWLVENLPTWIFMGNEFISRIQIIGRSISNLTGNLSSVMESFGSVLNNSLNAILNLDFSEFSEGSVSKSFEELNLSIENLGNGIMESFKVFSVPLTESLETGEKAPDLGEMREKSLYEDERPPSGQPPAPSGGLVSGAYDIASKIGANKEQWDIYRNTLAQIESGGRYDIPGGSGKHYDGRYQMGADAKTDAARILGIPNPGHSDNPNDPKRVAFRKNKELQERMFAAYTLANHGYLSSNRTYQSKPTVEQKLQILGYAHNQGAGGAANWLKTGRVGRDGFGTAGTKYTDALARNFRGKVNPYPDQKIQESTSSRQPQPSSQQQSTQSIQQPRLDFRKMGFSIGDRAGYSQRRGRTHAGRDIAIVSGTPLYPITDAIITDVGHEENYGYYVVYRDSNGIEHFYGHMREMSSVKKNQRVSRNTVIGYVGSTGRSTGPHLHWEVSPRMGEVGYPRKNVIDPLEYGFSAKSPFESGGVVQSSSTNTTTNQSRNVSPSPSSTPIAELSTPPISFNTEQMTPERSAQNIFIVDDRNMRVPQPQYIPSVSSNSHIFSQNINEFDLFNRFVKNKLLIDLSYV